jgi:flagellin
MPMYINTNISSLQAQRNLNRSQDSLQSSFRRLSSGLRINTAADDAAGCAVSEAMKAQIRCLVVAERNANNAVSMTQTAEGGLSEISNMVVRMRELAVQAANGDLTDVERGYLDTEFQLLTASSTVRICSRARLRPLTSRSASTTPRPTSSRSGSGASTPRASGSRARA